MKDDIINALEKQYEAAKSNGHGQTALKALELLSRVRGNNQEDNIPDDLDTLENEIKNCIKIIGKEKIYSILIETFPEDFEDDNDGS